ncbi:MAG: hypothetical protein JSR91_16910 [Proteobacteria bacterium]|nr:hypothetical protein [Pseudomonadota bacterium]
MGLKKIRLELARTPDFPDGSSECGYELTAPLTRSGKLDPKQWMQDKDKCAVRRFWKEAEDEHGRLTHHRGGTWAFSYKPEDEDEPIFRFDKHKFAPGEYVSVTERDGIARPFRVIEVGPP